jgi:hypothetical protein
MLEAGDVVFEARAPRDAVATTFGASSTAALGLALEAVNRLTCAEVAEP